MFSPLPPLPLLRCPSSEEHAGRNVLRERAGITETILPNAPYHARTEIRESVSRTDPLQAVRKRPDFAASVEMQVQGGVRHVGAFHSERLLARRTFAERDREDPSQQRWWRFECRPSVAHIAEGPSAFRGRPPCFGEQPGRDGRLHTITRPNWRAGEEL